MLRRARARRQSGAVAVALQAGGLAVAHVRPGPEGRPRLEHCAFLVADTPTERQVALAELVAREGLSGARAVFVLGPGDYCLRVVDAPAVAPAELAAAARWSIQDLIEFDAAMARVEVFGSPPLRRQPAERRIYVAAALESTVHEVSALATASDLELEAIDIPELALRNLAALDPGNVQGLALVALHESEGLITIVQDGYLCGARWIATSTEELARLEQKDPEDRDEADSAAREQLENLSLQVQRSLDYHEHELGKRPVAAVALAPVAEDLDVARDHLANVLGLGVRTLDLNTLLDTPRTVDRALQARCAVAVGGCLREQGGQAQQIDLARPLDATARVGLSTFRMVQCAAGLAALLVLSTGWMLVSSALDRRAIARLDQQLHVAESELAGLEARVEQHLDVSSLDAEFAELAEQLQSKQRLLRWIGDPRLSNPVGFSTSLRGLARRRVDDLWLRAFEFENGGRVISLRGSALHAASVPRFLQGLSEEETFRGTAFHSFSLRRSEQEPAVIEFEISNRSQEAS